MSCDLRPTIALALLVSASGITAGCWAPAATGPDATGPDASNPSDGGCESTTACPDSGPLVPTDARPDSGTTGSCVPDRAVGELQFCFETDQDSYGLTVRYTGAGTLDLTSSETLRNGSPIDLRDTFDPSTQTFALHYSELAPSKYSHLFRLRTTSGAELEPLFVPMWIGRGIRYSEFSWRDAIMYQVLTDRFLNGDPSNDLDNAAGDLAQVQDTRSQWQGGDFAGITAKLRDGYFEQLGINALWISSPILNSHNSQPGVGLADSTRYASYHAYHPVATGYTHRDHLGYDNPIEPAFGTAAELHELVNEAHLRGIRVLPDFVTNHVHIEGAIYQQHPEWFFPYSPCDGRWDEARVECWFTTDMPDFDYQNHPDARALVVAHAIWMIQEFNFDGFRVDALKHMDDSFVYDLKAAVVEQIETTVNDHYLPEEPTIFYMVGESLGGWARYHVREEMVQGQVDEWYSDNVRASLLTFDSSVRNLANFALWNDTAYLTSEPTMGGHGGYPGAVMGNFFGNHDQWRALTVAGGDFRRLRLAQAFLLTSPGNIPMLYQGDDIGTFGEQDPDNRRMHIFTGLSDEQQRSLDQVRLAGQLREAHPALRRGVRATVHVEDWFWVYQVTYGDDLLYVAINRDADKQWSPPAGFIDGLGNCAAGIVPTLSACIFVQQ